MSRKQYFTSALPTAGLNYSEPGISISERHTPDCSEVRMGVGLVEKTPGSKVFSGTVDTPLNGTVMALNYVNSVLICHTTTKVYSLVAGTFTDETDAGGPFTGTILNPVSSIWMYDSSATKNYYIFANGIEQPRKWDQSTALVELLANTATKIPDWIAQYGSRLCMYNVTDGGTDFPKRVRWSAVSKPEDHSSSGSGFADLYAQLSDDTSIVRAEKLGDSMIIYGDHSMAIQQYTQATLYPFAFYAAVPTTGLAAPRALLNIHNREHLFLGWDDVYMYRGELGVERVGGVIRDELFDIIDPDNIETSFMVYIGNEDRARLHIPQVGSSVPDVYFEFNLKEKSWTKGARTYSGYGEYQVTTTEDWDGDSETWDDDLSSWNSATTVKGFPLFLYGNDSGEVHQYPSNNYSLIGTAISAHWDTKDFTPDEYRKVMSTWLTLQFEASGNTVDVSYSTDAGISFTDLETVTLTDDLAMYRVDLDVHSSQIRFRFANNTADETFKLRWFEVGYVPGSEWYRS